MFFSRGGACGSGFGAAAVSGGGGMSSPSAIGMSARLARSLRYTRSGLRSCGAAWGGGGGDAAIDAGEAISRGGSIGGGAMGATAAVLVAGGAVTGDTDAVSCAEGGEGGVGGSGITAVVGAGALGWAGGVDDRDFGIAASAFSARSNTFSRAGGNSGLLAVFATSLDWRADFPVLAGETVAVTGASPDVAGASALLVSISRVALAALGASVVTCAAGGVAGGVTSVLPDGHN
jgi:hypothetical protein